MNDTELFEKAAEAGYNYQKLYGKFPDKIGIHYKRLSMFHRGSINFPVMPQRLPVMAYANLDIPPDFTISIHQATFDPVIGTDIEWDEVYVPAPGWKREILSGRLLAKMAREFEE